MPSSKPVIRVEGARQNNLKGVTVEIPIGAFTAVTGVAGAGKSSLAFDVLYAEGYRRYVETFSPYARQFLERLDRPRAERIEGVLPSVAIDQTAPVRTSRSTVGTMTSVADYLRALFSRASTLHCRQCGKPVERSSPSSIFQQLLAAAEDQQALLCFDVRTGSKAKPAALRELLDQQGFRRVLEGGAAIPIEEAALKPTGGWLTVVLDRITIARDRRQRLIDSLEAALRFGKGKVHLRLGNDDTGETLKFSEALHCPDCDIEYSDPTPGLFSFNNPIGACETCKGFGRTMDIDPDLVVPDARLSVAEGCVRPFQSPAYSESQDDLMRFLKRAHLSPTTPWRELDAETRALIWKGEPGGRQQWQTRWYGIEGFFNWLESRTYRMHVRVLLSRYRRYQPCPDCGGARLKANALLFRIGGRTLPEIEAMSIADAEALLRAFQPPRGDTASQLLLREIHGRLRFLLDVGVGYLTLARQSRTLSGGEAQRVTLATALGSSLTSTLYVLDEPSIGLHARDAGRLAAVLRRLAADGNAVVVVEHDPAIISAADHVVDLGPGPGRDGGEVVYQGPVAGLVDAPRSRTGAFLAGRLKMPAPAARRRPDPARTLRVLGARENNLKDLTVDLPLGLLVCVTGVSGSGKSTLVDQVLYRNVRRALGLAESEPGACGGIEGAEQLAATVIVDQSPLGRSSRVNAATYLGVLEPLREQFAATADARSRGLKASAFSFNSAAGACPVCEGAGYEAIELQFLPDAYVRCPACDGRRYKPEVLEVRCRGLSIAELLDLPAQDVARRFADCPKVVRALQPLIDIGLGYLALSQPAPTLSGGEAQRLKLAGALAQASGAERQLFILDEPTTGLHASDVAVLAGALQKLVDVGQSVVVIEHNLELARAADWIIDLGPEGGDEGGRIVGQGTPEQIAALDTATGHALREAMKRATSSSAQAATTKKRSVNGGRVAALKAHAPTAARNNGIDGAIQVLGAREHNLQAVSAKIPRGQFVAVTGVSGSGKSTLAFDVLYAEGQRRFLDCLPTYARQFIRPLARPEVDRVEGVPPTVALEQKLSHGTPLSTAGTASEVYHYLRLLFAFLGVAHCPECGLPGEATAAPDLARRIAEQFAGDELLVLAPLVRKRKGLHKEIFEAAAKRAVAEVRVDGKVMATKNAPALDRYQIHDIEAVVDRIPRSLAAGAEREARLNAAVERALLLGAGMVIGAAKGRVDRVYSTRRSCPSCGAGLPVPDPRLFTFSQKFGACPTCAGLGMVYESEFDTEGERCPDCDGTRLRPEARAVMIGGRHIGAIAAMPVHAARAWVDELSGGGSANGGGSATRAVASRSNGTSALAPVGLNLPPEVLERVVPELQTRLALLEQLGLGYLTLDRGTDTLSTGEAQRIRIVAALASNLRGVCYVLDEPTVGLHPRDSQALSKALFGLRDRGNTVIVVEHDEPLIRAADHVIDLGPGAGPHGGRIVAEGTPAAVMKAAESVTGAWLRHDAPRPRGRGRPLADAHRLEIVGARLHNLRDLDVEFPLGRLIVVTGVSGSGKSTLVRRVLYRAVSAKLAGHELPDCVRAVKIPRDRVRRALEVDESPIGRTPRSVPATYVGIMDSIRQLFATSPEARARGYGAGRFSFNVAGGRCEKCEGQGRLRVSMPLLPEVYIPCETCGGRRYNADTLAVTLRDKSIADVLSMTVEQAQEFFQAFGAVRRPLDFLAELGLTYLQLGQPSPTLSGGEAQRIKLASELASPGIGPSFYVLDEPTTGLHMADVAKLVGALQRLVERGDTVVVIEHNLDLIAAADCLIDLGPEGGEKGGRVVAWGAPEEVAKVRESRTAPFLRAMRSLRVHPTAGNR